VTKKLFSGLPSSQTMQGRRVNLTSSFIEFKKKEIEQSIPERFEHIARTYPERTAVKTSEQKLAYKELNQTANRVAHTIRSRRREGNEPIALLLEQSASLSAATIGTLKAGQIYVPLDPYYPKARLAS
jgi:non-ribosomal peptide synthetase component F